VTELEATDRVGAQGRLTFNEAHDVVYGAGDPSKGVVPIYYQFTPGGEKKIAFPKALAGDYAYAKAALAQ
jgi:hypothetical protein